MLCGEVKEWEFRSRSESESEQGGKVAWHGPEAKVI